MNILHVASLSTDKSNGINVVVPQHVYNQAQITGVNVALFNIRDIKDKKDVTDYDINYLMGDNKNFLEKLPTPFDKPDLVIFHGIYYIEYIPMYKQLLKEKISYIVFPHGSLVKNAMKTKALKKYTAHLLFFNRFIKNAVAVQFLTEGEKNNSVFSKKGIVLPNGFDIPIRQDKDSQEKDTGVQIIFIGRKDRIHKGLDLLLDAIISTKQVLLDSKVEFLIIGPDRNGTNDYIDRLVEKHSLQDIVRNMDGVFGKEKEKVLDNCDIFVHTSRWEGLPTSVIEAMLYKKPVLVTKGTNLYEDVAQYRCGWTADDSTESIKEQLESIVKEKDKIKEYGENAYSYAKECYNWEKVAKDAIKQYRKMVR